MNSVKLISRSELYEGMIRPISVNGLELLAICSEGKLFVVENKCGHFGIPLSKGTVANGRIRCPQHGAEFDLQTGAVLNHVVQQCDPIKTFRILEDKDNFSVQI